jgi:hypothetical protein
MTTTLEKRVTRLEETTEGGDRCPECGWDGDPKKTEYAVEWQKADSPTEPDEFCETCGCQLTYTVDVIWDDSPASPEADTGSLQGA